MLSILGELCDDEVDVKRIKFDVKAETSGCLVVSKFELAGEIVMQLDFQFQSKSDVSIMEASVQMERYLIQYRREPIVRAKLISFEERGLSCNQGRYLSERLYESTISVAEGFAPFDEPDAISYLEARLMQADLSVNRGLETRGRS